MPLGRGLVAKCFGTMTLPGIAVGIVSQLNFLMELNSGDCPSVSVKATRSLPPDFAYIAICDASGRLCERRL